MIGPFVGPESLDIPHSRLLYKESSNPKSLWSTWVNELQAIDNFLKEQPNINPAGDDIYLYYFGGDKEKAWVGREIIGHKNSWPSGMGSFDSFAGSVFEWSLKLENTLELTNLSIFDAEQRLRALAPTALAATWRVKIKINNGKTEGFNSLVTFQFYKLD